MWEISFVQRFARCRKCTRSWELRWLTVCLLCLSFVLTSGAVHLVSGQSAATLRIYLARHGETEWNVERLGYKEEPTRR